MTHFLTLDDGDSDGIPKRVDRDCERGADHHQLDGVDDAPFHWGPDPGHGGLTKHKGARADCPGPDCGESEHACMTTVPAGHCMCGNELDEDGDCPRCILELDECSDCQAVLDELANADAGETPMATVEQLTEMVEQLVEAIREELASLWYDLHEAINRAIRCTWSIEALGVKERIQTLTKLVGPTPWESIQLPLLEAGIYQQVHAEIGVDAPVDMQRVAEVRRSINERMGRLRADTYGGGR